MNRKCKRSQLNWCLAPDTTAAMLVERTIAKSILRIWLWKFCYCFEHQHGLLITWLQSKNWLKLSVKYIYFLNSIAKIINIVVNIFILWLWNFPYHSAIHFSRCFCCGEERKCVKRGQSRLKSISFSNHSCICVGGIWNRQDQYSFVFFFFFFLFFDFFFYLHN